MLVLCIVLSMILSRTALVITIAARSTIFTHIDPSVCLTRYSWDRLVGFLTRCSISASRVWSVVHSGPTRWTQWSLVSNA